MIALVVVLAAAAIGTVGATGASAATFKLEATECKEGFPNVCWVKTAGEVLLELAGTQTGTVEKKEKSENISFTVAALGVEILCEGVSGINVLLNQESPLTKAGKVTGQLLFTKCKLDGELGEVCTIPVEKETEPLTGELTSETELLLKPTAGKTFITIPFEGASCPATVKGPHEVTGEDIIEIIEGGVHKTTISGKNSSKSKLKFSEKAAVLKGELTLGFPELGDLVDVSLA